MLRINAFDWHAEFKDVMGAGGFDAVVGNPPYIRIQALKEWAPIEVEHYKQAYRAAGKGNYDIYVVFVERGLQLLNPRGRLGFILPHKFFNAKYGEPLRGVIAKGRHLSQVVHFADQQVFSGATTYTCLMFLDRSGKEAFRYVDARDLAAWRLDGTATEGQIAAEKVVEKEWNFTVQPGASLFERLNEMPVKLEDVTDRIFQGIKTSADKIYIVEELARTEESVLVWSPEKQAEFYLEPTLLHPLVKGGDSKRFQLSRTKRLILFPYAVQNDGISALIPEKVIKQHYPLTWAYLLANRQYLENREHGKMKTAKWYGYVYPKALDVMPLPKIFTPDIAPVSAFSLDETGEAFFTGGVSGGYGILVSGNYSREYMLGLLNSRLLQWLHRQVATQMRGGWYSYESRFIKNLPIRTIDPTNPTDKASHDHMVALVERMLDLNKRLAAEANPQMKTVLQRQIGMTDGQIDSLVYGLYGLTGEEIAIVEGG